MNASAEPRDGSSSVCTKPECAPIHYHWYRFEARITLIDSVKYAVEAEGLTGEDVDRILGEVRARLLALVDGLLTPIVHIKGPMETVTDLWVYEIRAGIEIGEGTNFAVRVYHVEPSKLRSTHGTTVVGLHLHAKDLDGTSKEIRDLQDAELQVARDRYFKGQGSSWGGATILPQA
ncbi:MAG: hypothetical protein Q7T71_17705 [Herbiconiux sp.]|nr:hypothetical protein [Herbiconiux sp.]